MKAHQHLALLRHESNRKSAAKPIAPGWPFDRPENLFGPDLADMPKRVFQGSLLDGDLGGKVQMLHFAAAASAVVRALRLDALGTFAPPVGGGRLLPLVLLSNHVDRHFFCGQCAIDENHLALGVVRNPLRLEIQGLNFQPFVGCSHAVHYPRACNSRGSRRSNDHGLTGHTAKGHTAWATLPEPLLHSYRQERAPTGVGPPKAQSRPEKVRFERSGKRTGIRPQGRSSLERGLPRAGPPKGQTRAAWTVGANLSGKADRGGMLNTIRRVGARNARIPN